MKNERSIREYAIDGAVWGEGAQVNCIEGRVNFACFIQAENLFLPNSSLSDFHKAAFPR